MGFIRTKKIKGNHYAYLVENRWKKKTSKPLADAAAERCKVALPNHAHPTERRSRLTCLVSAPLQARKHVAETVSHVAARPSTSAESEGRSQARPNADSRPISSGNSAASCGSWGYASGSAISVLIRTS